MQVSVEQLSTIQRCVKVTLPVDYTKNSEQKKLKEMANSSALKGFRKGKVPFKVIEQRFGESVRIDEINNAVNETLQQVIMDEKLAIVDRPAISNLQIDKGKEIYYEATFEIYPDIELGDLTTIKLQTIDSEVIETDVTDMIETLRKQRASWNVVDREAKLADRVEIDFKGTIDGEVFEGGEAEGHTLDLGSGSMILGFEDQIVGMTSNTEKTIEVTFPEDYQAENLRGKKAIFHIKMHHVSEAVLPEINDEFMQQFDVKTGISEFKAKIKSNMENNLIKVIESKLKDSISEQLEKLHDIEVPSTIIKQQIEIEKRNALRQMSGGGAPADFDLSTIPDEPFAEKAKRGAIVGLVFQKLIEEQGIKVDNVKLKAHIKKEAEVFEKPEEVEQYYYGNENMFAQAENRVLEQQVLDFIISQAQMTPVTLAYQDVLT